MKRIVLTFFAVAAITFTTFGQAPEGFKYQAVVRDNGGTIIANQAVGVQMTVQQGNIGGTAIYQETFSATTNAFGLVNLEIGTGTTTDDFTTIDWSAGPYFIATAIDAAGGISYVVMGASQLMSVPYALYAKTSGSSTPGSQGATGPSGADGSNGSDGATGATGSAGTQGPIGLTGPAGAQGATGLLSNGNTAGNTPYWDGSQWVVNNSNIHNNGAGVGIGTAAPNASAKVEIASTTQGFLPPRMTSSQRDVISSPAAGLTIYNTTVNCLQWWNGSLWYDGCGNNAPAQPQYPVGSVFCASGAAAIVDVTNPTTGEIWMDRNLGATQAATSSTDVDAYGDLYQWGRFSDGHQCRTSNTTATLSSTDQPAHGDFILGLNSPYDWRSPQNDNLWQGVNGTNNPCPSGYRIPTEAELEAERLSWSSNGSAGALVSPLKLPLAGGRNSSNGSLNDVGLFGFHWSSTVSGANSRYLNFFSSIAIMSPTERASGRSVRCLKD
jgi:hypothetical protein